MSAPRDHRALQYAFAAHLRDPARVPPPDDVEPRRVAVYRDLLYRNVEGFMARAFPVLRTLLDERAWHGLVGRYFAEHRARTPLFPRMPREFLRYLANAAGLDDYPPYMAELADYEWLEAEVLHDTRELDDVALDACADFQHGCPVVNPTLRARTYAWPVHRIGPDWRPTAPAASPVYLAVYRKRDDRVGFMELNAVTARLLDLMLSRPVASGTRLLERVARELAHPEPARLVTHGLELLESLRARELVLGTRSAASGDA